MTPIKELNDAIKQQIDLAFRQGWWIKDGTLCAPGHMAVLGEYIVLERDGRSLKVPVALTEMLGDDNTMVADKDGNPVMTKLNTMATEIKLAIDKAVKYGAVIKDGKLQLPNEIKTRVRIGVWSSPYGTVFIPADLFEWLERPQTLLEVMKSNDTALKNTVNSILRGLSSLDVVRYDIMGHKDTISSIFTNLGFKVEDHQSFLLICK